LWVLLQNLSGGCLVTDPIDFENEPNVPTSLLAAPGSSIGIGEPFWIDREQRTDTGEFVTSWSLSLQLRDENLGDELEARWRVVTVGRPQPNFDCVRFSEGLTPIRDLELTIKESDLSPRRCHRLELIATRMEAFFRAGERCELQDPATFSFIEFEDVEQPARASWVIFEGPGAADLTQEEKGLLIDSCNALEDLLSSATTEAP
jgi:hypothetical protein